MPPSGSSKHSALGTHAVIECPPNTLGVLQQTKSLEMELHGADIGVQRCDGLQTAGFPFRHSNVFGLQLSTGGIPGQPQTPETPKKKQTDKKPRIHFIVSLVAQIAFHEISRESRCWFLNNARTIWRIRV
jgi:hypothetical protein